MKKLFLFLCLLLSLSLAACADAEGPGHTEDPAHTVHVPTGEQTVAPTCVAPGARTAVCADCGVTYVIEELPPTGQHAYGESGACAYCNSVVEPVFERGEYGYTLTAVKGEIVGSLTLPAVYRGEPVTAIGEEVLRYQEGLTHLSLPTALVEIGDRALQGCTAMTELTLPNSLQKIGVAAFGLCSGLKEVSIPCGVERLEESLFYSCTGLQKITLPDGLASIGEQAFYCCEALAAINIPESVREIDLAAFLGCTSLSDFGLDPENPCFSVTDQCLIMPESRTLVATLPGAVIPTDGSVTRIGAGAFCYALWLEEIVIPDCVTDIGQKAFRYCQNLKKVTLPSGLRRLDTEAFYRCDNLTEISLPSSLLFIGESAFGNTSVAYTEKDGMYFLGNADDPYIYLARADKDLETAILPNGTKFMENRVFYECEELRSVTLPASLLSCGMGAFSNCFSLREVHISDMAAYCAIDFADGYATPFCYGATLYINSAAVSHVAIPEGIEKIGAYAFAGAEFRSLSLPDSLREIGDGAFENSSIHNEATLVLPAGLERIGADAFRARILRGIHVGAAVREIGPAAFATGDVDFHLTLDGDNPYYRMAGGCLIRTADRVLIFGNGQSVIPTDGSVTAIGERAFYDAEGIYDLVIPEGIEQIGSSAFFASDFGAVSLPNSLRRLDDCAFDACAAENIRLGENLTYIGDSAFSQCRSLVSVAFSANVTYMGAYLFNSCDMIQDIYFDGSYAAFEAIEKHEYWNYNKTLTVHCTDGDYTLTYQE